MTKRKDREFALATRRELNGLSNTMTTDSLGRVTLSCLPSPIFPSMEAAELFARRVLMQNRPIKIAGIDYSEVVDNALESLTCLKANS